MNLMTERQLPLSNVEKAKERLIDIFQWLGEMRLTETLCNFNLSFPSVVSLKQRFHKVEHMYRSWSEVSMMSWRGQLEMEVEVKCGRSRWGCGWY